MRRDLNEIPKGWIGKGLTDAPAEEQHDEAGKKVSNGAARRTRAHSIR